MTETKFTPGPWRGYESGAVVAYGSTDTMSCAVLGRIATAESLSKYDGDGRHWTTAGSQAANAHLIAAAPDLYEALDTLVNSVQNQRGIDAQIYWGPQIEAALTALAKARGEAE